MLWVLDMHVHILLIDIKEINCTSANMIWDPEIYEFVPYIVQWKKW